MKNIKQLFFPVFMILFILVGYLTFQGTVIRKGMTRKQIYETTKKPFDGVLIPNAWHGGNPESVYDFEFKNDSLVNWKRR